MNQKRFDEAAFSMMELLLKTQGRAAALAFVESEFQDDQKTASAALDVCEAFHAGRKPEALNAFLAARKSGLPLPEQAFSIATLSAVESRRWQEMGRPLAELAERAAASGDFNLALETVKKIYSFAKAGQEQEFLASEPGVTRIASLLESIASKISHLKTPSRQSGSTSEGGRPRIAFLTVNMVDGVQAYAKTALQFARYARGAGVEPLLLFADETCGLRPQRASLKFQEPTSRELGKQSLAEIEAMGVRCVFAPPELGFSEAALWLASEIERSGVAALIAQAGINSPMQWLAAKLAEVPFKVGLCLGVNMYQKGVGATVYMSNSVNLERERAFWRPEWGSQVFLPGGADLQEAAKAAPLKRDDYMMPENAVVFGMLSNYVSSRVTDEYLSCVAAVLKACPEALFACMGNGEPAAQAAFMEKAGVLEQCRWLSWQHKNSFASLKLLDFYYNEFPIGGAQALIESMACGVPATSMLWSNKHHESVGADIVGPEFAVMERNPKAYIARAIEWVRNPAARAEAAKAQLARAKGKYSAERFVQQLCELAMQRDGNARPHVMTQPVF